MEKGRAPGWTESRNMTPQGSAAPGVQGPGEGVGGVVNATADLPPGTRQAIVYSHPPSPHSSRADILRHTAYGSPHDYC